MRFQLSITLIAELSLSPGHLSVRVGDSLRRCEEIVKSLELRLFIYLIMVIIITTTIMMMMMTTILLLLLLLTTTTTTTTMMMIKNIIHDNRNRLAQHGAGSYNDNDDVSNLVVSQ